MNKSITVKELKEFLKDVDDDKEVFVGVGNPELFGLDITVVMIDASKDKQYVALMSHRGDIIKI